MATFDGTVLEVFTDQHGSTTRLHLRLLHLAVDGPDRSGRYEVKMTTQPSGRGGGTTLFVPPEAWPQVQAFVGAVALVWLGRRALRATPGRAWRSEPRRAV